MIAAAEAYFKSKLEDWDLPETLRETDHVIDIKYLSISQTFHEIFPWWNSSLVHFLLQQQQQTHS